MSGDHDLFMYRHMDRSELRKDSRRFRVRVDAAFVAETYRADIARELRARAGIEVPHGTWGLLWHEFWTKAPLDEVLTAITIAVSVMAARNHPWARAFVMAVESAMRDEHLGLRIDPRGVVHFAVDADFEQTRQATLASLDVPGLSAARAAYEAAFQQMDRRPAETKAALLSIFEAAEILAKQLFPQQNKLNAALCRGYIKEAIQRESGGDDVELRVIAGLMDGMADWVDAMHQYRHGQADAVKPPTAMTTVLALTSGMGFVRALAQLAAARHSSHAQP